MIEIDQFKLNELNQISDLKINETNKISDLKINQKAKNKYIDLESDEQLIDIEKDDLKIQLDIKIRDRIVDNFNQYLKIGYHKQIDQFRDLFRQDNSEILQLIMKTKKFENQNQLISIDKNPINERSNDEQLILKIQQSNSIDQILTQKSINEQSTSKVSRSLVEINSSLHDRIIDLIHKNDRFVSNYQLFDYDSKLNLIIENAKLIDHLKDLPIKWITNDQEIVKIDNDWETLENEKELNSYRINYLKFSSVNVVQITLRNVDDFFSKDGQLASPQFYCSNIAWKIILNYRMNKSKTFELYLVRDRCNLKVICNCNVEFKLINPTPEYQNKSDLFNVTFAEDNKSFGRAMGTYDYLIENNRDKEKHYNKKYLWPARCSAKIGENNQINPPLIKKENLILPPLQIKLGLFKQFVKGVFKNGYEKSWFYLTSRFPNLSSAKIKEGIFNGPKIRKIMEDEQFEKLLKKKDKDAWSVFVKKVYNVQDVTNEVIQKPISSMYQWTCGIPKYKKSTS